jgi:plasmid segregation protein ParM
MGENKVVRAIDVGYGNVKYTTGVDAEGKAVCGHFPAVAAVASGRDIGAGVSAKKDVVTVAAGGNNYLVGPDALLSLKSEMNGRVLSRDYPETDRYLALARGALAYMDCKQIDLLVTGLPVAYLGDYKGRLENRLAGEHQYPDGRTVIVRKAWAIPQPLGGYLQYAIESRSETIKDSNCLVVDAGFFTVDWLVCRGLKVIDERSGSLPGGMSKLLARMAEAVSEQVGEPFSDINRLDEALRNGGVLQWYGQPLDIKPFTPRFRPEIDEAVEAILASVGSMNDIGSVLLVGGGAGQFQAGLKQVCRRNPLSVADDGMFANVRGFHLAGAARVQNNGQ